MYDCSGALACYGDHFGLGVLHICTTSEEEAGEVFQAHAREVSKEAKCGDSYKIWYACTNTKTYCQLEEENAE